MVIKNPTTGHLAAWLHWDFGVRPVALVRHPCGNVAGYVRMGWSGVSDVLARPGWAAQLTPDDREYVERHGTDVKDDPVLSAALEWRAINGMLLALRETIPELVVTRYEDLAGDPEKRFPALANQLGLRWAKANTATLAELRGPVLDQVALGSTQHDLNRDPVTAAWSWQNRLSQTDVDRVLEHAGPLVGELGYGP